MRALAIILAVLFAQTANAADLEIALTDERVAVDTSFSGARVVLFGAVTGAETARDMDIIAVIRGPAARFEVRQMAKNHLIWTPGRARFVENAPGLYLTYSTRPVSDVAPLPLQAEYKLDADHLDLGVTNHAGAALEQEGAALFRSAFLTEAEELGIYAARTGGIRFGRGALFSIDAQLPAKTPVGDYIVDVFLLRHGELLSVDSAALAVNRVGLERRIYEFAHKRPVSYGIFCVALALIAGWLAGLAFRKS